MVTDWSGFAATGHWDGCFDAKGLQAWARHLRAKLRAPEVSLGLVFMSPRLFPHAEEVLETLRVDGQALLLVGCSGNGLLAADQEYEENAGLAVGLYYLPGGRLRAFHFDQPRVEAADGPAFWHVETGVSESSTNGWLAFIDPFHLDSEAWLRQWNEAYPGVPVLGGLASGRPSEQRRQVYLNSEVWEEGGVAVSFSGEVSLSGVISQGCSPFGDTWTITKVERNVIREIGGRPAYVVLVDTISKLAQEQRQIAQQNPFIGLASNEYQEEFRRGDFLVRNLLGGDPRSGALVVGALPRAGQTLQFHCSDPVAAAIDFRAALEEARRRLAGSTVYGGCLCTCAGRGRHFFGKPHHDAALIQSRLGPLGLTGVFCQGEIGPVGDRIGRASCRERV